MEEKIQHKRMNLLGISLISSFYINDQSHNLIKNSKIIAM